jgi:hypothetical protein
MANFYTMTEILNAVYSGTSLTGFSTDAEILNTVFNGTNALKITLGVVPVHTDNAAALLAGLTVGMVYRTADVLKVVHS